MMMALINILLAVIWAALRGEFSGTNLLIGFALGYGILALSRYAAGDSPYFRKMERATGFLFFVLWELLLANLEVAREVLKPLHKLRPAIVKVPLDAVSNGEITTLAIVLTLVPGTVSLDLTEDRKHLYVHTLAGADPEAARRDIKQRFERRILEIFR
jgi:multicomponent Na+:H+ antiporter subunit E